ncbi:hypothetical protein sscle_08g065960 [Sclerotinia sclerotiorum 1980 UF-70]|uniref:Tat pathway signal sequence n=1 Tax=Sclerotinia sclerotiorum (strain ATCC 18683 / 1980 / Ss-1) TaxID=665079 RepID=A0A1D9QA85_SCLS1|nr:hypothetical protein sscle_08g065960 [Sclerotinia sclerotiorum 1980 UF-70]
MSHIQTTSQFLSSRGGYQLPSLENDKSPSRKSCSSSHPIFNRQAVLIFFLFAFGMIVSFVTGRYYTPYQDAASRCQPNIELPLQEHKFVYNQTFVETGPTADKAWESLFPAQGGYFRHPTVSPARANFAVFHQLHCLDKMRLAYWALYDGSLAVHNAEPGADFDPNSLSDHFAPLHITHCFELIRNALVCRPDTTVEVKDLKVNGVTGFEAEHFCVDWNQLVNWVSKWENYGKPGTK